MKIIKITESQYKKLVKTKNLNEQFETVYKDESDKFDITVPIQSFINWITDQIGIMYNKNLFIDKIQDGVVYIDWENYSEDEKNSIESLINDWVEYTSDSNDELVSGDYFSGLDWDYEEDYKPKRLCWCDGEDGEKIEYDCDDTKPEGCLDIDDVDDDIIVQGEFGLDNITDGQKLILFLISEKESVNHSYNSAYPGKIISGMTDLTLKEVKDKYGSGAKGRYQFLPKYFETFANNSNLKMSDKFSPKNQDKMAIDIFKDKMGDCLKLEDKLVRTWAALPVLYSRKGKERVVKRGQSYYAGDGINKALVDADHFEKVLKGCGCDMSKLNKKMGKKNEEETGVINDSQSVGSGKYHSKLDKDKYNVTNKSVGAKNTSWMFNQLKKQNLDKYDVVIIMGGGNDGYREKTDKTAQSNLDKMYNYVKNNSNSTLIAISNPTKKFYTGTNKYPSNELIAKHAIDSEIPDYNIDANSLGEEKFSKDKIHLNSEGHEWIYNKLKEILDNL
jgi:lysophospholipase L1-like esterase